MKQQWQCGAEQTPLKRFKEHFFASFFCDGKKED
jgi:hypothetical protein